MKLRLGCIVFALAVSTLAPVSTLAQGRPSGSAPNAEDSSADGSAKTVSKTDKRKQFVIDVVRTATALPVADQQDRLRVLYSASNVIFPIRPAMAVSFSREGLRIEQELIQQGKTPAVSMLDCGGVDCGSVKILVENVPAANVDSAEQSLVGAVSKCAAAVMTVRQLLDAGFEKGRVAPRASLAVMERVGVKAPWSQQAFEKLFASLPSDANAFRPQAADFATTFTRMAPEVDKAAAGQAGLRLLAWLGKIDASADRNLAVNATVGSLKELFGDKGFENLLASDVMARQAAQTAGQPGEMTHPPEESVSVLRAIARRDSDRTDELNAMPPSLRAREAAASGFASGTTDANRKEADHYFDIAFAALNDVWDNRASARDVHAVVQEVAEAAAQVDAVDALQRTRRLQDPTAQAIAMLAVARVVASR
jgi:hypothetical protein